MTQSLWLRAGVHLAAVGDDLIALDVAAGAYVGLPGIGGAVGPAAPDGRVEVAAPLAAGLLREADLIAATPRLEESVLTLPSAVASSWRTRRAEISSSDRRRVIKAYVKAAPRAWRWTFRRLVTVAARERTVGAGADVGAVAYESQILDQLLPLAPFQGECLFRSFLLLTFLRQAGHDAAWVFGVRTYPFEAHCWLQVGETVLDDVLEHVRAFAPILTV